MTPQELAAAFAKVWGKVFNPRSACPDIELGHLSDVLASTLVEEGFGKGLSDVERWALAKVAVEGNGHPGSLCSAYCDRVPYYSDTEKDANGYPKPRPHEEYYQDQQRAMAQAGQAVQRLVEEGHLVERDGRVYLP